MPRNEPTRSDRGLTRGTLTRRLGQRRLDLVKRIGDIAGDRGWGTFLVGGVVRDLLLGRPTKDLDLVVVGDARKVAKIVARGDGAKITEHTAFGTASIEFEDGLRVDLATARRESYARPAALPSTSPSNLIDDLARRDFSVNSMALDLSPTGFGTIVDPCGGREDLRRGSIRVLHDRSFIDDPTRVFRALRFASRLDFEIESDTESLMRQAIGSGLLDRLSATRVRHEIHLLFEESGWPDVAAKLGGYGAWSAVEPSLGLRSGDGPRLERAENWVDWYGQIAGADPVQRWALGLAVLAQRSTRGERERLVERLRPDRHDTSTLLDSSERAREILRNLRSARHPRPSRVYRVCEGADVTTCLLALAETRPGAIRRAICTYLERWRSIETDISGDDLMRAGVQAGPRVGVGLRAALEAKLDGRAPDPTSQLTIGIHAARTRA
jgi:tRNA nucleotidyltransferase (CCA-adding enzyme)